MSGTNKKLPMIIIGTVLASYFLSYATIRLRTKAIIRISTISACTYSEHSLVPGDAILVGYAINTGLTLFFTPLRWLELGYWNLVKPIGSEISPEDLKLNKYPHCKKNK